MRRYNRFFSALLLALVAVIATPAIAQESIPSEFDQPSRIVAMSFIGGHIDELRKTLREREIIDENDNWIGGDAHYVQMGEVALHGLNVLECLELIHNLEPQAEAAGGKVHMLLGVYESMILRGDAHRIRKPNYEDLADPDNSDDIRAEMKVALDKRVAQLLEFNAHLPEAERQLNADRYAYYFSNIFEHPGAWVFIQKFAKGTELGDWLRSRNSSIQIGPYLLTTGGIHPDLMGLPLSQINNMVRDDVNKDYVYVPIMAEQSKLPNWWTKLSGYDDPQVFTYMKSLIEKDHVRALIVNHANTAGKSINRWNLYQVMSDYTHDGNVRVLPACLEITKGEGEQEDSFVYYAYGNRVRTQSPFPVSRFQEN